MAFDKIPLFGSAANFLFIVCGSLLGLALRKRLSAKTLELPLYGMGLFVISLGLSMSIKTEHPLIVISSIALGSITGELLDMEGHFLSVSKALERKLGGENGGFSAGFMAASLIFCTGSMAVLGSFQEGLGGYPSLLLTKGLIDGITAIALSASLGFGVIFSSISVFAYQGLLTVAARWLQPFMTAAAVSEMSAAGGLMLIAIGLGMIGVKKIRVMNMLPALIYAVIAAGLFI